MIGADFALYNVDHLVTVAPGCHPAAVGELATIERGALASRDGKIVWVGPMEEMRDEVDLSPEATVINAHGRTVLPGFVDPHTHPIFAGGRTDDFYARALRGQHYSEQLETGGIMQTVRETRSKSEDTLLDLAYQRANVFLQYGTTTVGAKTGYGLTEESEIKGLRALNRLQHLHTLKLVPTLLGAHVVPSDYGGTSDAYVQEIVDGWLPAARDRAQFVDVWCDNGAFTSAQCRSIMERARDVGFLLTAHANEMGHGDGVLLAVEMEARSVDHAVYLDRADVDALSGSKTVAVLLPGTTFFLGSNRFAPARELLESGATVALGTDFNPGTSYTQNMQFILTLAVLKLRMTPEEAIRGATVNAARALDLDDCVGSLDVGKFCDFGVYCVGDYREIPYYYAMNLVETVVACGKVVVREGQIVDLPRASSRPV